MRHFRTIPNFIEMTDDEIPYKLKGMIKKMERQKMEGEII